MNNITYHQTFKVSKTLKVWVFANKLPKYALTINDEKKLIDVFISDFDLDITIDNMFQIDASRLNIEKLFDKYFYVGNANRKLKVDSNDDETDLKEFLDFIEEGDLGVTLFETTDNFQTFENVSEKITKL